MHLTGDPPLVPLRGVRPLRVQPLVPPHQMRVVLPEPGHEPLAGTGPQMQHQGRHRGRPGGGYRPYGGAQLGRVIAEEGDHRGHQDPDPDAVLGQGPYDVQASLRGGRPGLHRAPQRGVGEADGDGDADVGDLGGLHQEVQVAQDQRALRQDREGVRVVAQGAQDARHQSVAALRALVAVDVRAHRDVVAEPAPGAELAAQQVRRVHLDHDLGVEAEAGVEVQIAVGLAGEAVDARVRAAPP